VGFKISTAIAALAAMLAFAAAPARAEGVETVDVAKLMEAGPLPEQVMGDPKAPVTIVEYASLTCPHCANFNNTVFPTLKEKYIDTGKVYFVMREYPLDQLALVAVVAARCASTMEYFPIIDALFENQKDWAFVQQPGAALLKQLEPFGFTEDSLNACLQRKEIIDAVVEITKRGHDEFGIDGTPAFFINGERHTGEPTLAQMEEILRPMLDKATTPGG